jgi:hypothetical protein
VVLQLTCNGRWVGAEAGPAADKAAREAQVHFAARRWGEAVSSLETAYRLSVGCDGDGQKYVADLAYLLGSNEYRNRKSDLIGNVDSGNGIR